MRRLALLSLSFALAGCTVSQDQEVAIGQQDAEQINAQLPIVQDPVVADYIQRLGERMAQQTSRANLDWHFYVVNAAEANAFALPGGYVYVNRGLVDLTRNEAELAGAIGHEIGHVVERHAVKQMQSQQTASIGVAAVCMLTSVCHSGTAQAAIQVGGAAVFAHHSRHDEAQADSEAIFNTLRAGIDPRGVPALFDRLLRTRQQEPTVVEGWFADHPLEESRIRHTESILAGIPPSSLQGLEDDSEAYRAMRARLDALPAPRAARARGVPGPVDTTDNEPPGGPMDTVYVP